MQPNPRKEVGSEATIPKPLDGLGDYPQKFQAQLERQGFRRTTLVDYSRCVLALGQLMQRHGLALGDLSEAAAVALIVNSEEAASRNRHSGYRVKRFLRFLKEQGVNMPPSPAPAQRDALGELREDYESYLRLQRGLSDRTISDCWRFAEKFLAFRFGEGSDAVGHLSRITAADIAGFLQHKHSGSKPYRVKTLSTHLRRFFRYLFKAGRIDANLALGIPSVAQRYGTRLPRRLTPEQVELLLAAVRSDTPMGRRNHAMVLLLARLGLRAPEVVAMQLEDVDWRSGEIVVRGKGQRHDRVPLPQEVGQALADYIRLDRATTSRAIFVTDRAPHGPFKGGQLLNTILRDAFAKTGIKPPTPYVGSHILRHSLATNLVQRGASLEEIADLLRHRSRVTTMIYAKLDIDGLRSVAQPWPAGGGAK